MLSASALAADAAPSTPTLFVAGDSTAAKYTGENPQQGWGEYLGGYFNEQKLRVVNRARGGRSSRTFITEGHWDLLLAELHAGDYVIIQFGHNDAGAINQEPPESRLPLRARGTIRGIGSESEEIDNVITGLHETVYSFGWYLRKMIADVRAAGATPILLTLTERNSWNDGRISCPSDTYRQWTYLTAVNEKVAFLDLSRIIADRYQRIGPEAVKAQFSTDSTHTSPAGAQANAADVLAGLRALREPPFRSMLSAQGRKVKADRGAPAISACPSLHLP